MARLEIKLQKFKVINKNEWSDEEPYLWCFGLVIDSNTIRTGNFVIKKKPGQGNLRRRFKKGESRTIPSNVGQIITNVRLIGGFAGIGVLVLAWEEDNTPNAKVKKAYEDSVKILNGKIKKRINNLDFGSLSQSEIAALKRDLKKAIEKRFKAAVHWYDPWSWDPDDFIGFNQMFETVQSNSGLSKPLNFIFKGDDAKYQVIGQLKLTP